VGLIRRAKRSSRLEQPKPCDSQAKLERWEAAELDKEVMQ